MLYHFQPTSLHSGNYAAVSLLNECLYLRFVYSSRVGTPNKERTQAWSTLAQTASALHPQTLSTIPPSTGQNKCYGNILFCTRHLCLQSKWPTMMEITDVSQRRMFPQRLFCPVDARMVLRVQGQSTSSLWQQGPATNQPKQPIQFTTHQEESTFITYNFGHKLVSIIKVALDAISLLTSR